METTKWRKRHGNFLLDDAHAHRNSPLKSVQIAGGAPADGLSSSNGQEPILPPSPRRDTFRGGGVFLGINLINIFVYTFTYLIWGPLVPLWVSKSECVLPYSYCGGECNVHYLRSTSGATHRQPLHGQHWGRGAIQDDGWMSPPTGAVSKPWPGIEPRPCTYLRCGGLPIAAVLSFSACPDWKKLFGYHKYPQLPLITLSNAICHLRLTMLSLCREAFARYYCVRQSTAH